MTGGRPASQAGLAATDTLPARADAAALHQALAFTEAFRRVEHEPAALREASCLAVQFPATLLPIEDGDRFVTLGERS